MIAQVSEISTELKTLSVTLSSTLEESVFFGELGKFFQAHLKADHILINKIHDSGESSLIVIDGQWIENAHITSSGIGPAGHVAKSRRPYFSNNVSRDPIFTAEAQKGIVAELCLPIACDGVVIATLHVQMTTSGCEFVKEDILAIQNILEEIKRPITNMKMYLSAKSLNSSLLRKIEEKDKELELRTKGLQLADAFKIEEKEVIGKSEAFEKILKIADKIAQSDANILIQGEAGSGKELVARRIHCRSSRRDCAFLVLDCSALSGEQLESELFGEELMAGGVRRSRQGVLEIANGGTLFIENLHMMPASLQLRLTQFLKNAVASRVGAQSLYKSNVRFFAASSRSLSDEVENGHLREDLFYALSTMSLQLPALREHREDIETLAHYFLNHGKTTDKQKSLSPSALKSLLDYHWPGNIRELQNVMERAYILSDGIIIEKDHLADSVIASHVEVKEETKEEIDFAEMTLEELEKRHIVFTLNHLSGNKTKTAKSLGITVKTLYNKLHSYGMIQAQQNELH